MLAATTISLAFAVVATAGERSQRVESAGQAPSWLKASERQTLRTVFGNARPIEVAYISYPKKIAVIWTFRRFVARRLCGSPTDRPIGGRVVRVSFDRQTHGLGGASDGWAMQFCDSVGVSPPKQACLHR
jgi:hypothetical protein